MMSEEIRGQASVRSMIPVIHLVHAASVATSAYLLRRIMRLSYTSACRIVVADSGFMRAMCGAKAMQRGLAEALTDPQRTI
jgi:hypothetical protein